MANGYMPRSDVGARNWLAEFAEGLAQRPTVYKVSAGEVAAVTSAVDAFAAALRLATQPSTRTGPAIVAKDAARAAAENACRPIYLRIKIDPGIPNDQKVALGVRPVNPARPRIGRPSSWPVLQMRQITGHSHVLTYHDSELSAARLAKPAGATGIQLFRHLGDRGAALPSEADYLGTFTRAPIVVDYDVAQDLQLATYFARWINRKGQTGPWSGPLCQRVTSWAPAMQTGLAA